MWSRFGIDVSLCRLCFFSFYELFSSEIYIFLMAGKKKKDQHDANQVGVGLTPAYGGAYGTTPSVSMFSVL